MYTLVELCFADINIVFIFHMLAVVNTCVLVGMYVFVCGKKQ